MDGRRISERETNSRVNTARCLPLTAYGFNGCKNIRNSFRDDRHDHFDNGLRGYRPVNGDRVRLHPIAVGNHYALFGISGFERRDESLAGWSGRSGWLRGRIDDRVLGGDVWRAAADRKVRTLCFDLASRSRSR